MTDLETVFVVGIYDWHYGADTYPYSTARAALEAAWGVATRRAERPEDIQQVDRPDCLLLITYSVDGDDMVWVQARPLDGPVVEFPCDCAG